MYAYTYLVPPRYPPPRTHTPLTQPNPPKKHSNNRQALLRWGDLFLASAGAGKERSMQWTLTGDAGLKSLSYYTDNGAYYYYHTEKEFTKHGHDIDPLPYVTSVNPIDPLPYAHETKQMR